MQDLGADAKTGLSASEAQARLQKYGANALAKEGKSYDEILKWYYTGIDVAPYTPQR